GSGNQLFNLHQLDIVDKHRLLVSAVAGAAHGEAVAMQMIDMPGMSERAKAMLPTSTLGTLSAPRLLKEGMVLGPAPRIHCQHRREFIRLQLMFDESDLEPNPLEIPMFWDDAMYNVCSVLRALQMA